MSRRNNLEKSPEFTMDEIKTATLLLTEGWTTCDRTIRRGRIYLYPRVGITMCDKEALIPAEKVFQKKMRPIKFKEIVCDPEIHEQHTIKWEIDEKGYGIVPIIKRLQPLLTKAWLKKHKRTIAKCPPHPPYRKGETKR